MPIDRQTAKEAYKAVLENAGTILPKRDVIDTRIINEVRGGCAIFEGKSCKNEDNVTDPTVVCGIIDTQSDVGWWPVLKNASAPKDTDHDGMPYHWEDENGLDKKDANDRNTMVPDGLYDIEKVLKQHKIKLEAQGTRTTTMFAAF